MRAGSNGSNASTFSPVPANFTGRPVTAAAESAAPPRESPSSLVSTMPGDADPAVELVGALHRVLAGERVGDVQHLGRLGRLPQLGELRHQGVVDVQPAGGVDDDGVVTDRARLGEGAQGELPRGSRAPGGGRATPACAPTVRSCSRAAGRWTSVDTSSGWRPRPFSQRPSLAVVVVFPDPCRPVIRITLGTRFDHTSGRGSAPPSDLDHLVPHQAQNGLVGAEALQHVLAHGTRAHALDELLGRPGSGRRLRGAPGGPRAARRPPGTR